MIKKLLSTKEVAEFLGVNEKMIYSLVSEKGLPASKVTGKWIFPLHLVEQWVQAHTLNYPETLHQLPPYEGILILTGSNDLPNRFSACRSAVSSRRSGGNKNFCTTI